MFSILYAVVLRAARVPRAGARRARLADRPAQRQLRAKARRRPTCATGKQQQRVFSAMAGTTSRMLNLTEPNAEAERITTTGVSHDYFAMLGVAPLAGRGFVAADDREGAEPVAHHQRRVLAAPFRRRERRRPPHHPRRQGVTRSSA